jgi:hypothetical protein
MARVFKASKSVVGPECIWVPLSSSSDNVTIRLDGRNISMKGNTVQVLGSNLKVSTFQPNSGWSASEDGPIDRVVLVEVDEVSSLNNQPSRCFYALAFPSPEEKVKWQKSAEGFLPKTSYFVSADGTRVEVSKPCELNPVDYARKIVLIVGCAVLTRYEELRASKRVPEIVTPGGLRFARNEAPPDLLLKNFKNHIKIYAENMVRHSGGETPFENCANQIIAMRNKIHHDDLGQSWLTVADLTKFFETATRFLMLLKDSNSDHWTKASKNLSVLEAQFMAHLWTREIDLPKASVFFDQKGREFKIVNPCELKETDYLRRLLLHTGKALSYLYAGANAKGAPALDARKSVDAYRTLKHFTVNFKFYPPELGSVHHGDVKFAKELLELRHSLAHGSLVGTEISKEELALVLKKTCDFVFLISQISASAKFCYENMCMLFEQFQLHHGMRK